MKIMKYVFLLVSSLFLLPSLFAAERYRDQFPKGKAAQGYYFVPAPYSLEGIGSGIAFAGSMTNVGGSYADIGGFYLTGDIQGGGFGASDIHLQEKRLIFDVFYSNLTKVRVNRYNARGMDSKDEDFTVLGLKNLGTGFVRLTKTNEQRDLEFSASLINSRGDFDDQFDKDGNLLNELNGKLDASNALSLGFRLDNTDDYNDPRRGNLFKLALAKSFERNDFVNMDTSYSHYLPFFDNDTLVFNAFYSESIALRDIEVNRNEVEADLGLNCADESSVSDRESCNQLVDSQVAQEQYGNATSLGGRGRLRAFPNDRFEASKTLFFGSEYRLNFGNFLEFFNVYLAKGAKNNYQFAFFTEAGSVSDQSSELTKDYKSNVGAGFRIVLASGFVFRMDYANALDGKNSAFTAIVGYPWDALN